jgi:hypothetical protein
MAKELSPKEDLFSYSDKPYGVFEKHTFATIIVCCQHIAAMYFFMFGFEMKLFLFGNVQLNFTDVNFNIN